MTPAARHRLWRTLCVYLPPGPSSPAGPPALFLDSTCCHTCAALGASLPWRTQPLGWTTSSLGSVMSEQYPYLGPTVCLFALVVVRRGRPPSPAPHTTLRRSGCSVPAGLIDLENPSKMTDYAAKNCRLRALEGGVTHQTGSACVLSAPVLHSPTGSGAFWGDRASEGVASAPAACGVSCAADTRLQVGSPWKDGHPSLDQ